MVGNCNLKQMSLFLCTFNELYVVRNRNLKPNTVKILKFGTPQTIAIIVLKIEKFDVTSH